MYLAYLTSRCVYIGAPPCTIPTTMLCPDTASGQMFVSQNGVRVTERACRQQRRPRLRSFRCLADAVVTRELEWQACARTPPCKIQRSNTACILQGGLCAHTPYSYSGHLTGRGACSRHRDSSQYGGGQSMGQGLSLASMQQVPPCVDTSPCEIRTVYTFIWRILQGGGSLCRHPSL